MRDDVDDTDTSFSLSSLDVLLTSTITSFFGSVLIKLRHWNVKWPAKIISKVK